QSKAAVWHGCVSRGKCQGLDSTRLTQPCHTALHGSHCGAKLLQSGGRRNRRPCRPTEWVAGTPLVARADFMTLPVSKEHRLAPLQDKPAGQLLLHEIYRSIQGESTFAGLPCVFVRLAVCDARCVWCDTPHAFTQGTLWTLDDILAKVEGYQCLLVEITG